MIDSQSWTGRPADALLPLAALRARWNAFLWPVYPCGDCMGMAAHGCYCAVHGCVAPCAPAEAWRVWLRKLPRRLRRLRRGR